MGTHPCKLVCDEGDFFLAFNTTVNLFVSPTFESAVEFAEFAVKELTVFGNQKATKSQWQETAERTQHIYKVTKDVIHHAILYLARLKDGESLIENEACELYEFVQFLKATVADHQYDYLEISQIRFDSCIENFGMRQQFPKNWNWQDILDHAEWESYQKLYWERKNPDSGLKIKSRSTLEQCNKLAARYLTTLVRIAQITGLRKRSALQLIKISERGGVKRNRFLVIFLCFFWDFFDGLKKAIEEE